MTSAGDIQALLGTKTGITAQTHAHLATFRARTSNVIISVPRVLMPEVGALSDDPEGMGGHIVVAGDLVTTIAPNQLDELIAFVTANAKILSAHDHYPVGLFVGGGLPVIASDAQVAALSSMVIDASRRYVIPRTVALALAAFSDDGPIEIRHHEDRLIMASSRLRVSVPWREVPALSFSPDVPGVTFPRADLKRFIKAGGAQQSWLISPDGTLHLGEHDLAGTPDESFAGCEFLCDLSDLNRVLGASKTPSVCVSFPDARGIIIRDTSGRWAVAPRRYLTVT